MQKDAEGWKDIEILSLGAGKSFANAEQLFFEAELLLKNRFVSRAYFLHQISIEECAKVDMLTSWIFGALDGLRPDFKRIKSLISSHAKKNRTNAYHIEMSDDELNAKNTSAANALFKKKQEEFHQQSNNAKNAALYVDLADRKFVTPNESISKKMVVAIRASNEKYLGSAYQAVKLLERFLVDPERYENLFKGIKEEFEKLRSDRSDKTPREIRKMLYSILDSRKILPK